MSHQTLNQSPHPPYLKLRSSNFLRCWYITLAVSALQLHEPSPTFQHIEFEGYRQEIAVLRQQKRRILKGLVKVLMLLLQHSRGAVRSPRNLKLLLRLALPDRQQRRRCLQILCFGLLTVGRSSVRFWSCSGKSRKATIYRRLLNARKPLKLSILFRAINEKQSGSFTRRSSLLGISKLQGCSANLCAGTSYFSPTIRRQVCVLGMSVALETGS